jgi:hypothetical protein
MADDREVIVNRIKKLMAYASDGSATEAEVEAATGRVRKLMDEWNIAHSEISTNHDAAETAYQSIIEVSCFDRANAVPKFFRRLAHVPDKICDTSHYLDSRADPKKPGKTREHVVYYGLPRDVEVAVALFRELLATCHAMTWFRCGKEGWGADHNSYAMGFADRLLERAKAQLAASQVACNTTAIVLVKGNLLKRYHDKIGLSPMRSRAGRMSGGKYDQGYSDGAGVSLGVNQISRAPKGLLD